MLPNNYPHVLVAEMMYNSLTSVQCLSSVIKVGLTSVDKQFYLVHYQVNVSKQPFYKIEPY
uniref:Putative ovule protein n=1 Tax=Solanum chacoense TaxID=4108 RepID=A0A0V0HRB9_SOLCH